MITQIGRLYVAGGSFKKIGTTGFSATRYLTILASSEKKSAITSVKRSLEKEANKIKNSGSDDERDRRALQKIKYVIRKADEKIIRLNHEERISARLKRTEIANKKQEAKELKKKFRINKFFRKSDEHGNIVNTAFAEKSELNKGDFSSCLSTDNSVQATSPSIQGVNDAVSTSECLIKTSINIIV